MDNTAAVEEQTPLDRAIAVVGTQQALADLLDIRSPSITEWKKRGVPAERCRAIETLTGGQVTAHDLRPDVFGPAPEAANEGQPAPAPITNRIDTPEAVTRLLGVSRAPAAPLPPAMPAADPAPDPEPEVEGDSVVVPFEAPP